jgi:hypothetical protein
MSWLQQHIHARDVIFSVCPSADSDAAGLFVVLLMVLWSNQNNKVWNDTSEPGRMLGIKARHLWEEWNSVQRHQQATTNTEQRQQLVRLGKPLFGWYKCNVDAAFHQALNKTSIGWCLRDHMGCFIMAETT